MLKNNLRKKNHVYSFESTIVIPYNIELFRYRPKELCQN